MEVVLSCCVGLLTSICVGLAPRSAVDGGASGVPHAMGAALSGLVREGRRAMERVDRLLFAHGVVTPRRRAEQVEVERAMPEVFGSLAVSLESGLSLPQAMQYVGGRFREPVRTEFLHASALMACGASSSEALDSLSRRLSAPDLDLVALALKVSARTGAPLSGLLADVASLARGRMELARELEVKTAQVRMSARLVASMPVLMAGFLALFSDDFRAGLLTVPGAGSMVVALLLNACAGLVIGKTMRMDL